MGGRPLFLLLSLSLAFALVLPTACKSDGLAKDTDANSDSLRDSSTQPEADVRPSTESERPGLERGSLDSTPTISDDELLTRLQAAIETYFLPVRRELPRADAVRKAEETLLESVVELSKQSGKSTGDLAKLILQESISIGEASHYGSIEIKYARGYRYRLKKFCSRYFARETVEASIDFFTSSWPEVEYLAENKLNEARKGLDVRRSRFAYKLLLSEDELVAADLLNFTFQESIKVLADDASTRERKTHAEQAISKVIAFVEFNQRFLEERAGREYFEVAFDQAERRIADGNSPDPDRPGSERSSPGFPYPWLSALIDRLSPQSTSRSTSVGRELVAKLATAFGNFGLYPQAFEAQLLRVFPEISGIGLRDMTLALDDPELHYRIGPIAQSILMREDLDVDQLTAVLGIMIERMGFRDAQHIVYDLLHSLHNFANRQKYGDLYMDALMLKSTRDNADLSTMLIWMAGSLSLLFGSPQNDFVPRYDSLKFDKHNPSTPYSYVNEEYARTLAEKPDTFRGSKEAGASSSIYMFFYPLVVLDIGGGKPEAFRAFLKIYETFDESDRGRFWGEAYRVFWRIYYQTLPYLESDAELRKECLSFLDSYLSTQASRSSYDSDIRQKSLFFGAEAILVVLEKVEGGSDLAVKHKSRLNADLTTHLGHYSKRVRAAEQRLRELTS